MLDQQTDDPISHSRFLLEAEITGALEQSGMVPVYGPPADRGLRHGDCTRTIIA